MPKKEELLIKEIYEYTIDKKTYKGSCKKIKVVKIVSPKNNWYSDILVLENGQELYKDKIFDLNKSIWNRRYNRFSDELDVSKQVFTIEKIPNIKDIFKQLKEERIDFLTGSIKNIKANINATNTKLNSLNKNLEELNNELKLVKGA